MPSLSQRLIPLLQLTRAALVFTAIADGLAAYLLRARALAGPNASIRPYVQFDRVGLVIVISAALYMFGMSLNDIIDRRRDQQLAAHRPLPSGRIGVRTAHIICALLAMIALVAGAFYAFTNGGNARSFWILLGTLLLISFYDFAGKYLVAPGLLTLGLIRFFHATIAAPNLPLLWHPLFLLNHVALLSTIAYVWEEKRPPLTPLHWWTVGGGLFGGNLAMIALVAYRRNPNMNSVSDFLQTFSVTPVLMLPVSAAAIFALLGLYIRLHAPTPRDAGQKLMLYGLLWLIVYDACFVAAYVSLLPALAILLLLPIAYLAVRLMRGWSNLLSLSQRPQFKRAGA
jgi:hypothetical protein